jgi:flagellar hook-length control protein FliK
VRPPELGEIRIGFQARDGGLTGHILAERESVRSWLEARVPAWREELASAGVKVDRIDVGLITQGQEGGHATPWQEGQPPSGTAAASGPSPMGRDAAESVQGQALGVNSAAGSGQIDYWA